MEDKEAVDNAAQDTVVAVNVLVRGEEGPGEGIDAFEREEALDRELRGSDEAETLGEVEVVCDVSLIAFRLTSHLIMS